MSQGFDRYEWQKQPLVEIKKLTFEEWFELHGDEVSSNPDFADILLQKCWIAAQENK